MAPSSLPSRAGLDEVGRPSEEEDLQHSEGLGDAHEPAELDAAATRLLDGKTDAEHLGNW